MQIKLVGKLQVNYQLCRTKMFSKYNILKTEIKNVPRVLFMTGYDAFKWKCCVRQWLLT